MIERRPTDISLVMVISSDELQQTKSIVERLKTIVQEVVVVCQSDRHFDWPIEWTDIFHTTTKKGFADPDRQFGYNLATKEWILALDPDEFPDKVLLKKIPKLVKQPCDVYWIKFKNLINGKNVKHILGDDPHPRLWRKIVNGQPTLIWPPIAHTFPKINSGRQTFLEHGKIIHSRSWENIKRVHEIRNDVIDERSRQIEQRFLDAVKQELNIKD